MVELQVLNLCIVGVRLSHPEPMKKFKIRGPRKGSINWKLTHLPDDQLRDAVAKSRSVRSVFANLNIKLTSQAYKVFHAVVSDRKISIEHFTGMAWNKGLSLRRLPKSRFFVIGKEVRGDALLSALIDVGVDNRCHECGSLPVWNGKPLRLVPDHIDGNRLNNSRENLRILCPNCHSQTDTFSWKNAWKRVRTKMVSGAKRTRSPTVEAQH